MAKVLAKENNKIIICSRNEKELDTVRGEVSKAGGMCEFYTADVTKKNDVEVFVDNIMNSHGRVDVLINNAGWSNEKKLVENISDEEYEKSFRTNVDSVFYFLRKVVPLMKRKNEGMIINISSGAGKGGHPGLSVYSASKFAVHGFTQSVARELEGTNVRCIAICPGGMNTEMRAKIFGKEDAEKQQSPESVAEIVRDVILGVIQVPNGGDVQIRDGKVVGINSP